MTETLELELDEEFLELKETVELDNFELEVFETGELTKLNELDELRIIELEVLGLEI